MQMPTMNEQREFDHGNGISQSGGVFGALDVKRTSLQAPGQLRFRFDYTQSSLWSPLIPCPCSPADLEFGSFIIPRNLASDNEYGFGLRLEMEKSNWSGREFRPYLKKKIATSAFNINLDLLRNKNKKRKNIASEFSPTPVKVSCALIITKEWSKMLKAASKHFKRKKKE